MKTNSFSKPQNHPTRNLPGFSMLESLGFLVALVLIGLFFFKKVDELRKADVSSRKTHGLIQLETAKTRYTQDATPQERTTFNAMGNEARFGQIASLLTPSDPVQFSTVHHLKQLDIGDLSTKPTAN